MAKEATITTLYCPLDLAKTADWPKSKEDLSFKDIPFVCQGVKDGTGFDPENDQKMLNWAAPLMEPLLEIFTDQTYLVEFFAQQLLNDLKNKLGETQTG